MTLPNFGNVFPDDILGRIRDLEDRINQLTGGTYGKVTVAGDVTGLSDDTTVERLQGSAVSSAAPTTGQVLRWEYDDGADEIWRPGPVQRLQGIYVAGDGVTPPANGKVLASNGYFLEFEYPHDGLTLFGSGTDGSKTLSRSSTVGSTPWLDKSGSGASTTFTLLRDVYLTTFTLDDSNGSFIFETNGYRLFCKTSCTIDADVTVRNNGENANADLAGLGGVGGTLDGGAAGSAGSTGTASTGNVTYGSIARWTTSKSAGDGGSATGGPGVGGGATGGAVNWSESDGTPHNLPQAMLGGSLNGLWRAGAGGAGGNGSSGIGGGGGGGGGIVAIFARTLVNNGTIEAKGGNGGAASGTNGGGGGGGSGGAIILVYKTLNGSTAGTTSVAGGTGGAAIGTGKTGEAGDAGLLWNIGL